MTLNWPSFSRFSTSLPICPTSNVTSHDPPQRATIQSLPTEILIRILQQLQSDQNFLTQICLVSKLFNEIAKPLLYRKIIIRPPNGIPSILQNTPSSIPNPMMVEYLRHTEILRVYSHHGHWCTNPTRITSSLTSEILPNLHTLSLIPSEPTLLNESISVICLNNLGLKKPCKVIDDSLRPKRLIISNVNLTNIVIPQGLPSRIFAELEEVILISQSNISFFHTIHRPGNGTSARPNPSSLSSVSHEIIPNLKKFTLVFLTKDPDERWKFKIEPDSFNTDKSLLYNSLIELGTTIFNLPNHNGDLVVEIVNFGCLQNVDKSQIPSMELQDLFKGKMRKAMIHHEHNRLIKIDGLQLDDPKYIRMLQEVDKRCGKIVYLTMQEYLDEVVWQDVFEYKEVKGWVE